MKPELVHLPGGRVVTRDEYQNFLADIGTALLARAPLTPKAERIIARVLQPLPRLAE